MENTTPDPAVGASASSRSRFPAYVPVRFTREQVEKLDRWCVAEGWSRADVLRRMVDRLAEPSKASERGVEPRWKR